MRSDPKIGNINYYDMTGIAPDSSHAYVLDLTPEGKNVLELGAGSGIISKILCDTKGATVTAVDLHPSDTLRNNVKRIFQADFNDPNWIQIFEHEESFDVIIAADVLEHTYDPWRVLSQMKGLLSPDGSIILSLPHASHSGVLAALLSEDFDYRDAGLLDKTHIRFFGLMNIVSLHKNSGLKITDARFTLATPEETELSRYWKKLPFKVKHALSLYKAGLIYQVIIKSSPTTNENEPSVDILDLPIGKTYPVYLSPRRARVQKICSEVLCSFAKAIGMTGRVFPFAENVSSYLSKVGSKHYQIAIENIFPEDDPGAQSN